jgi:hypothetical protein
LLSTTNTFFSLFKPFLAVSRFWLTIDTLSASLAIA